MRSMRRSVRFVTPSSVEDEPPDIRGLAKLGAKAKGKRKETGKQKETGEPEESRENQNTPAEFDKQIPETQSSTTIVQSLESLSLSASFYSDSNVTTQTPPSLGVSNENVIDASDGQIIPLARFGPSQQILAPQRREDMALAPVSEGSGEQEDEFLGFNLGDSGEDDGALDGLKGSDDEFVDRRAAHAQEGGEPVLRRSPKKHGHTVYTDFVSGLKKTTDLTFGQKLEVAMTLANLNGNPIEMSSVHKERLAELLSDFEVAVAVMEKMKGRGTEEAVANHQSQIANPVVDTVANNGLSSEVEVMDNDVFNSTKSPTNVSNTTEINIVERFLGNRINQRGKVTGVQNTTSVSTEAFNNPRYPHGYVPASQLQSFAEFDNDNEEQHYTMTERATMGPPSWSGNPMTKKFANPPPPRTIAPSSVTPALPTDSTTARASYMATGRPTNPAIGRSANSAMGRPVNPALGRTANPIPSRPVTLPSTRPTTQNAARPKQYVPLYEDEGEDETFTTEEVGKTTKRRKKPAKGKKRQPTKKASNSQGEFFDLDSQQDGNVDEEEDDAVPDYRLGYYGGELRKLIVRAIFFMRLFLLCMDAFPSKEVLIKWAEKSFSTSCQMAYGINYKDRMPPLTDGISTLLQNEGWGVRGKVKKAAAKVIERYYNIFPPANKYTRFPNADELETRYVEQRVKTLLGPQSLYLRGYVPSQGEDVPYAHPAIKEVIHILAFSKKASKQPLAGQDLEAFNPIPLNLIAYACTALLNVLEEYKSGEHVRKDFSEADYSNYYRILVQNLDEMVLDESFAPILQDIREDMFDSGCQLLTMSVHDEYERPPAPFVPTARNNIAA